MSQQPLNPNTDGDPAPDETTPPPAAGAAKKDWLHSVARATETLAPLVARQAPKPEDIPEDRRGRLTTLLAITGIFMAVLQFLVQAYDLVTRPLAPLAGALPYIAAGLLAMGSVFGLYTAWRAHSRRHRLLALGSTLLVLLVALSWGGWLVYDALRPPDGYRILVSEFDGSKSGESIDFGKRIAENLRSQLVDTGQKVEIRRTTAVYADPETARREGERQKAGIVIWGWYDDRGVSPHVEVLGLPSSDAASPSIPLVFATASAAGVGGDTGGLQPVLSKLAPVTRTPLTLPSIDLFTDYGPDQITYVASTVLAVSYLAREELPQALILFDQALASVAGDPGAAQGQEVVHFQRATVNFQLGNYAAARKDLEAALQLHPGYVPALRLLAVVLANQCTPARDLDAALAAAQQAATLDPDDLAAQQLLAELLLRDGDAQGALTAAERAVNLAPNNRESQVLLAAIYDALGRTEEGQSAREAALRIAQAEAGPSTNQETDPQAVGGQPTADLLYSLGDAYLALDRYDDALVAYQKAHNAAPQDLRVHPAKGNVYFWQGKIDEAIAEYNQWAKEAQSDPAPHLLLGMALEQKGSAAEALVHYRQAAQVAGCDPAPFLLLGTTLTAAGDFSGARQSYVRALDIDPQDPDAQFAAGANSLIMNAYADAVEQFSLLAAQRPQMMSAHYYLGSAYEGLGEQDKAQAAYAEAVRLGEQTATDAAPNAAPDIHLAFAYEKTGRIDDAIALYVRLLALDESPNVHAYLGALYADKGALDLARREYERAVELDPGQGLASFALANLAFAEGDFATAAQQYEKYLAIEETSSAHDYAGQTYLQLGDLPSAFRHLQAAAASDPGNADLAARLATVANWLNRLDDAAVVVDGALRLRPDDPGLYFTRAQLAYKRCDLPAAVAAMQRAVSLQPQNSLYIGALGGYLLAGGQVEQMQLQLAQLKAAPTNDFLAPWMAGILQTANDQEAAQTAFRSALAVPDLPLGAAAAMHVGLGQLAVLRGDLAAAGEEFTAALEQAPDYTDAEIALGDIALLGGDPTGAAASYSHALETLDGYAAKYSYDTASLLRPALHARLALAARRAGDEARAAAAGVQAHRAADALRLAAPKWPGVAIIDGLLALSDGQENAADDAFARAVACDATYATASEQIRLLVEAGQNAAPGD